MIDNEKLNNILWKLQVSSEEIEKLQGVKITFSQPDITEFGFQVQISVNEPDSPVLDEKMTQISRQLGFTQNIIGLTFEHSRLGKIRITGIKTRNRKYPVIGETLEGKGYKFTKDQVKRLLGGDQLINRNVNLDKLLGK